jgi:RES domain-containing protein
MKKHRESDRLQKAFAKCLAHLSQWKGELFRSASPRYANKGDIITGVGSKIAGARWNPPGAFHTVYGSLDVEAAVAEALAHFRHFALPVSKAMPRVIVALEAKLQRVLDITKGATRRVLGVSTERMLEEPWREEQKKGREALTQAIGRLAFEASFEELLVPSAARRGGVNLIIFPANLDSPISWLRILNKDELPRRFA